MTKVRLVNTLVNVGTVEAITIVSLLTRTIVTVVDIDTGGIVMTGVRVIV